MPRVAGSRAAPALGDRGHVLVTATGEPDDDQLRATRDDLVERGDGVRGLERAQDAFATCEPLDRREGLLVGARYVRHRTGVLPVRVLGTDAWIIEARADRVRVRDLTVLRRQHVALAAVQHTDP